MGTFLDHALKSSEGPDEWLKFFALTGSAFAHYEKCNPVPGYEHLSKEETYTKVVEEARRLSGTVQVKKYPNNARPPEFSMRMTLHAEDQYNFNPGMKDIASGIPDDENGEFVVCGLAHGYRHESTLTRSFSWKGFNLGVASMGINLVNVPGQPKRLR